jgi:hypothetical protein
MQALLSYDQSPPLAAPLRFFLTAPLFGILAGLLLLVAGPDLFASRWTPAALALTHLMTVGFMLQVMLGALVQILPVVAGANMARPNLLSGVVHVLISLGALSLAAAFLNSSPPLFIAAALLLGGGTAVFVAAAAPALYGIVSGNSTISGLKLALLGLSVTVGLGAALSLALGGVLDLPLLQLADIHLVWGFVGWGALLLAAVAYVVVPMFQLTPAYPDWFCRYFALTALALLLAWSVAELVVPGVLAQGAGAAVLAAGLLFAVVTLNIQRQSKRPRFDPTQQMWRAGMASVLAAAAVWVLAQLLPAFAEAAPSWPLLFGALLIFGAFVSVICGMLYKIVPFLIWLHLQYQGQKRLLVPNMKKIIAERALQRQMHLHFAACALLLLAVCWPEWLVYPAGLALIAANAELLRNLLGAVAVYREHRRKLAALAPVQPSGMAH